LQQLQLSVPLVFLFALCLLQLLIKILQEREALIPSFLPSLSSLSQYGLEDIHLLLFGFVI
jgi:hypothetical protein